MARQVPEKDITATLAAAQQWIETCLVHDRSLFSQASLWTASLVNDLSKAFVDHPDLSKHDFMTKLKGQMRTASPLAQQLMAEMLWILLLFPSNIKASTKQRQICEMWELSRHKMQDNLALLSNEVLAGVGSGGPGFNNYRPAEMAYLLAMTGDLKRREEVQRRLILTDYEAFMNWIGAVPQEGRRQFRHMLRFFAFPDRVERISSNNDRRSILQGFNVATRRETKGWSDQKLDEALNTLRAKLQSTNPSEILDFYAPNLKEKWSRKIKTMKGEVIVTVPRDDDEEEDEGTKLEPKVPDARQSFVVQSRLAEIGALMGFTIWIPRSDRNRIRELVADKHRPALIEELPLNYDETTLDTIEQIDVIWLKRRSIVRAFEVEHTTSVYSGLLRMADLLALQPNMDIRLHIVASDERREKVFREMQRPVFSLLDRGPLSRDCSFLSYESVDALRRLEHLGHTTDTIIAEYAEFAGAEN